MNTYQPGDKPRLSGPFRDAAGTAVDPGGVKLIFQNPAGTQTTLVYGTDADLIKDSVGNYHYDLAIPRAVASVGVWKYRWEATGNYQTADDDRMFYVAPSDFVTS